MDTIEQKIAALEAANKVALDTANGDKWTFRVHRSFGSYHAPEEAQSVQVVKDLVLTSDPKVLARLLQAYNIIKEHGRAVMEVCEAEDKAAQNDLTAGEMVPHPELDVARARVDTAEDALHEFAITIEDL